jgi:ATP-dependent Clp protease ATP-binding subunit ClpX
MPDQNPVCCSFCFNHDLPLYEGGIDPLVHICCSCAARAVAQATPQPIPEPATPVPPSKEERRALVPSPKSVVVHLDRFVIGQHIAKRRLALGVTNHFKRVADSWVADDPLVTDSDLCDVRI